MKGASSGTLKTRKGSLGSEVSTTLKVTLLMAAVGREAGAARQGILDGGVVPLGQETGNARGLQTLAGLHSALPGGAVRNGPRQLATHLII